MTIDELTDRILEWEDQRSATQSSPDRQRVRAELHDVDLPALDDRGVIDFNADEGIVGSHDQDLERSEVAPDDRSDAAAGGQQHSGVLPSNGRGYLAATVVGVLLVVLLTAFVLGEAVAAVLFAGLVAVATLATGAYRLTRGRDSV